MKKEHIKVLALREKGASYGQIAEKLDMKVNTVKSICRRNRGKKIETPQEPSAYTQCENCGYQIKQSAKRKKKRFCCDACRNRWWNSHKELVDRKAYYKIVCRNCGKVVVVYEDKRRKYCSHECYIEDRFGSREI